MSPQIFIISLIFLLKSQKINFANENYLKSTVKEGLCFCDEAIDGEHSSLWSVPRGDEENFIRMNDDDGFHSQMPLLFVSGLLWGLLLS